MEDLRTSVTGLADRIVSHPEERAMLGKALRVKISELRRRGEAVPAEVLDLAACLERLEAFDEGDLSNDLPI